MFIYLPKLLWSTGLEPLELGGDTVTYLSRSNYVMFNQYN